MKQKTIAILDYGMGNIHSAQNAVSFLGHHSEITDDSEKIAGSDILILPGVGAFGQGMEELKKRNLVEPILNFIDTGKPFIGICLGMQLLFETSKEHGEFEGLGVIKGHVKAFEDVIDLKVPHMGWNSIKIKKQSLIFDGILDESYFYFVHSFYAEPEDKNVIGAETEYGIDFCSIAIKDNVTAMQFHPEKSQKAGLKLLDNCLRA